MARFVRIGGLANGLDDCIQIAEGDAQALQDMRPVPGSVQLKLGPASDDLAAMLYVDLQGSLERQNPPSTRANIFTPKVHCKEVYL